MGRVCGLFGSLLFGVWFVSLMYAQAVHPGIMLGAVFMLWAASLRIFFLEQVQETILREMHEGRNDGHTD